MKTPALVFLFAAAALAQEAVELPDPTRASPRLKAALLAGGSAIPDLTVKGLVLSAARESGAVMLEVAGGGRVLARPGLPFTLVADGEPRRLLVKRISAEGIEIEAPEQKESVTLATFGPATSQRGGLPGEVDYAEFRDLPLIDALRMLSDQTGSNYSASVEANKIPVNAMLRNVTANSVVEEICKSHGLWFRRDATSGIMRIMTVGEFEKDLAGYREEQTEVFTLKYPNVNEVAFAIADLYGDRVEFALGAEESDADMRRDLEGRFDRFDVLNYRTQTSGDLNGSFGGSVVGGNVNGFFSNSGRTFGFNSESDRFGSDGGSRYSRNRSSRRVDPTAQAEEGQFRSLTPEQAQRVERALLRSENAEVEALRKRPATIFVTASRRNNQIAVRTADAGALEAIRALVTRMDVQTPLVLLEVKVVSIELGREFRSAFDYQFNDGTLGASFSRGEVGTLAGGGRNVPGLPGAGFDSGDMTFVVVSDNFRARMQLFEQKNRVKTLSTPTLLTANNEVSRIFLGEQRPIVTGISSQTILTDNNVATTPNTTTELRNVGTTLLITPNINSDRTVTLRLVQDNSFISPRAASIPIVTNTSQTGLLGNVTNRRTGVQNVAVDVVASRTVSGTFVAKDGMAIAVGGLIEDVDSDQRSQVPVLGDIPVLGFFFQRKEREKSRRELVMMIRPYVLTTPADGERISRDMLDRLAPGSVEKLVDEGFLPALPPVPPARQQARPPRSIAATKKTGPAPEPAVESKAATRTKKTPSFR
jgi:general secretion pathway protein D